jgi:cytochrome c-type protein NapB
MPHGEAAMTGAMSRCRQCHVVASTTSVMVASRFVGLPQGPWRGERGTPGAPPTIPHPLLLRDDCLACHAGPAARAEIRTPHPERERCQQCHVVDQRVLGWTPNVMTVRER